MKNHYEKNVCSYEQSETLNDLGIVSDSTFYWTKVSSKQTQDDVPSYWCRALVQNMPQPLVHSDLDDDFIDSKGFVTTDENIEYPALTMYELQEILNRFCYITATTDIDCCVSITVVNKGGVEKTVKGETFPIALGFVLIHLLKECIATPEEVNDILENKINWL